MTDSRADLHCHSTASEVSKLGVQRALGLPECATPPEEVYALAKRRGMDFVTITDHDTIDGVLEIADRPDVFVSEELTARFRGEPQAVHILCLRHHARTITSGCRRTPATSRSSPTTCTSARSPARWRIRSTPSRRRCSRATGAGWRSCSTIWEVRNGSRARELNHPAAIYVETHGGIGIGGSDDHAGVDIGRTWSRRRAPPRRRSSSRTSAPAASARAASRAAPPSGRTPRWRWPSARSAAATATPRRTPRPSCGWSSA